MTLLSPKRDEGMKGRNIGDADNEGPVGIKEQLNRQHMGIIELGL